MGDSDELDLLPRASLARHVFHAEQVDKPPVVIIEIRSILGVGKRNEIREGGSVPMRYGCGSARVDVPLTRTSGKVANMRPLARMADDRR